MHGHRSGPVARALVVLALALAVAVACSDDDASPRAEPTAPSPPSTDEVPLEVSLLQPGDCFSGLDEEEAEVTVVPCEEEHSAEMTGQFLLEGEEFPGADEVAEQAEEGCLVLFEDYAGAAAEDTAFRFTELTPTEEQWDAGGREVDCLVFSPVTGGELSSSVRGEG